MKNRIITLLCIVCLFTGNEVCRAQVQEVISGVVRNESNEPLDGAIISVPDNPEYTTSSDKDGKFIMEIPSGASMVICKIPGYRNQTMKFTLNKPVFSDIRHRQSGYISRSSHAAEREKRRLYRSNLYRSGRRVS